MKWSLKIGKFAGVDVYMHFTFLLLLGWVALIHWRQEQSVAAVIAGVAFILAIFVCVILHEFGHSLMARRYGIMTRDIILLPIGGVARLERLPTQPIQEFWVALAGPAVNVLIAVALFVWLNLFASLEPVQALTPTTGPFLERIMVVNVFMIVFNMIPAFPMDGGRVLRSLLALRYDYQRATHIAASIGQGFAVLFGLLGVVYNPFLLFIALFVWIGASQEASITQLKSAMGGIPVQQAMISDFRTLHPDDSLQRAVELTLAGSQKDFPVVEDGRLAGMLTQPSLLKALSEHDRQLTVSAVAQHQFETVDRRDMLELALKKLKACRCHTLPVLQDERLVGLVTMDNLGEFVRIQTAQER